MFLPKKTMLSSPTTIQRWHNDDIDEQAALLSGWQQEYHQLSCGKFTGKVSILQGPRIIVAGEQANQSLFQSVTPPEGSIIFGRVLGLAGRLQVDGREVGDESLIVLQGGRQYEFRTEGCTELLGISMKAAQCADPRTAALPDMLRRALGQTVLTLEQHAAAMLRQFWTTMSRLLRDDDTWPEGMPLALLSDTALGNIMLALHLSASEIAPDPRHAARRQARVVQRAVGFMRAHLDKPFMMSEVCAAAHVSQRTLQYHFERHLGMAPLKYLKIMRLNAARRELRRIARHGATRLQSNIADIAARCGYEHASRFAGDYRRHFGALPSETLRDAARLPAPGV